MPAMYTYAFESAPVKVRATLQAFNLVAQGSISSAISAGLALVFVPDNLNEGKNVNYYYYFNASVAVISIGLYGVYRKQVGSSRDFAKPAILDLAGEDQSNDITESFAKNAVLS